MLKFFIGLLFVFMKTNLEFIDTSSLYYISNVIGYILIYLGFRELRMESERIKDIQPFVIFMIVHSIIFIVLITFGHSIKTIPLSSNSGFVVSVTLFISVIFGMFMIIFIIHRFIFAIRKNGSDINMFSSVVQLERLLGIMMIVFIMAGIFFFSIQSLAYIAMVLLFIVELLLLIKVYSIVKDYYVENERVSIMRER